MPEINGLDELLRQMPIEEAGSDLVPRIQASLSASRRQARSMTHALRAALAALSAAIAVLLIPRLGALMALVPSDWTDSTAAWWIGLETAPVESFRSLGIELWSLPNILARSIDIEFIYGGLLALLLSWLTFKILLSGQVSRKVVLQ